MVCGAEHWRKGPHVVFAGGTVGGPRKEERR